MIVHYDVAISFFNSLVLYLSPLVSINFSGFFSLHPFCTFVHFSGGQRRSHAWKPSQRTYLASQVPTYLPIKLTTLLYPGEGSVPAIPPDSSFYFIYTTIFLKAYLVFKLVSLYYIYSLKDTFYLKMRQRTWGVRCSWIPNYGVVQAFISVMTCLSSIIYN